MLKFKVLTLGGVRTQYVPVSQLMPINRHDYWCAQRKFFHFKQNPIIDLEMLYADRSTKAIYCFDKYGEWHDEGVEHESLSLEKTYNELAWFDEFNPQNT